VRYEHLDLSSGNVEFCSPDRVFAAHGAVASRRYMSVESIAKALADPEPDAQEAPALPAAA